MSAVDLRVLPASPLNAPGLLTAAGWDALRSADAVALSCAHPAWAAHLREAGLTWHTLPATSELPTALASWLRESEGVRVWLADAEHPHVSAPPEVLQRAEESSGLRIDADYVFASPVAPGAAVVESVRIMHELRSPGGDPWSAAQSHGSLSRYLLEETYEVIEELEREPRSSADLVDELGDLLFQLVIHARIGMEAEDPWNLDSVARALNRKMYRRNPHVFSDDRRDLSVDDIIEQWGHIKAAEKPRRSLGEGIPLALPALQRAFKIAHRARTEGRTDELMALAAARADGSARDADALALLTIAVGAVQRDDDPESALRTLLARIEASDGPADA